MREKRTGEVLKKWNIEFSGAGRDDPKGFLGDRYEFKQSYGLTLEDVVKALPTVLDVDT